MEIAVINVNLGLSGLMFLKHVLNAPWDVLSVIQVIIQIV